MDLHQGHRLDRCLKSKDNESGQFSKFHGYLDGDFFCFPELDRTSLAHCFDNFDRHPATMLLATMLPATKLHLVSPHVALLAKKFGHPCTKKMLYNLLVILYSLGVGNRVSKSDRPFGGKKEEEGSLLIIFLGILCSHSLGVCNRDRPFGGKKEEEGSLLIIFLGILCSHSALTQVACAAFRFFKKRLNMAINSYSCIQLNTSSRERFRK